VLSAASSTKSDENNESGNSPPMTEHEFQRSSPDFQVHIPERQQGPTSSNQHFLVVPLSSGTFVAIWTQASSENARDQRVVSARSTDGGNTWSDPLEVAGADESTDGIRGIASWGVPIVAPGITSEGGDRVYCLYNKNVGIDDAREDTTGEFRFRYSDDGGKSWSQESFTISVASCAISHPDPTVPESWIMYQCPTVTEDGTVLAGFTHWASDSFDDPENYPIFRGHSEIRFLRFENLHDVTNPEDIEVTTWPDAPHGLQVPSPERPGISVAQEPSVRPLPDGRLICVMRTLHGRIYFALSEDGGRSWDTPRPLHFDPEQYSPMKHPMAPCPLYTLDDGRMLLVFFNNDGTGHGANDPKDIRKNRTPAWYAIGQEVDHPTHPIAFDGPWILADNDRVPYGPNDRTEIASYPSFFEFDDTAYFWYPDRKHFLLGKDITAEVDPETKCH
jgi:hypothetical protein